MQNKADILQLIQQGENKSVEFKNQKVKADSLAKEIIAFANSDGGTILIGVNDDGTIDGIDDQKTNYEEWIANISRNNIIPSIESKYFGVEIENKKVGVIMISKGQDKPYQTTSGKYYIRIGSTNRIASQQELLRLYQASGAFHYDLNPVPNTGLGDLNFAKLDNYFHSYQINFTNESETQKITLLKNTDILTKNEEVTIAGLLIFGINPSRHLFQNGISFAYFSGQSINEDLIDKQNIDGNLDYQIDIASKIIKKYIAVPSTIIGTKRVNQKFIYPDKVTRELVTNAVVHRNYAISGSRIRIFLFEDRLEVISPGRLPNTVEIEKLRFGVSFAVNPVIVKFMENMHYIDQLGRGLPMVYHEATTNGKQVEFYEIGEEFKVTLEI
ncbi:MAG: ATP-dependent DNA helicase RecG [Candidatus Magnetoglobus multicellularis str. Araruama]|uniref:ATP-dependent DNA helicase RecG n=1 Tax=Candidatus Magnetoglobus multicellularis str. Araruama TaxID=890399 RepID=A0A1V1NZ21_9BACT|nr:MAG: ATP-dependent DNA helicase RecG [Candidatus Magnetoglobus multicellularis str. Araruama]